MSHTNLITINSTEINNSGPFRVGDDLTSGTAGQVLKSRGSDVSPEWGADTDTTYQGSSTIDIDTTTDPDTINCLKVPNALTFTGTATGTYDGSSALSINLTDTDTTYQGSSTIDINTATNPDTINCLKVPNVMTAGTNISMVNTDDGASATTYDGSEPITITAASSGTTYQGGTNISIDTSTTPDSINLDTSITGQTGITFLNSGAATNLTGSNYPGKPTTATYLDLTSSTNLIPSSCLGTKVQRTALTRVFSNSYTEYSSNFRMSFVALSDNVLVEFRAIIRADNRVFYGGLYDYNAGSYVADCRFPCSTGFSGAGSGSGAGSTSLISTTSLSIDFASNSFSMSSILFTLRKIIFSYF